MADLDLDLWLSNYILRITSIIGGQFIKQLQCFNRKIGKVMVT